MNIVLNQKDADFILKYIRGDLERLIASENSRKEKYERLEHHYGKIEKKDLCVDGLMKAAKELHEEVNEEVFELHQGLDRCVELLMCGSEASDENS